MIIGGAIVVLGLCLLFEKPFERRRRLAGMVLILIGIAVAVATLVLTE